VRVLLWIVLAAVVIVALTWALQRRLIYLPTQVVPAPPAPVEEVTFETDDGLALAGWFLPATDERREVGVLVSNGNAGTRALRLPLAERLADAGFDVLLFDYRGYGGNPGSPSEDGLHRDALAARQHLADRPETDPDRLVYFGESLGAGVALGLAVEHPPAALVLRSPFTSLVDVGRVHYPFLPVRLLLRDRYPSLERIATVDVPVLVVAGEADRIVPLEQSRELEAAAPGPSRFVTVPGAGHNDAALTYGDRVIAEVVDFATEHLGPP
jgi:uncharacterized protein